MGQNSLIIYFFVMSGVLLWHSRRSWAAARAVPVPCPSCFLALFGWRLESAPQPGVSPSLICVKG